MRFCALTSLPSPAACAPHPMRDSDDPATAGNGALAAGQLPDVRPQMFLVGDYTALSAFIRQGARTMSMQLS